MQERREFERENFTFDMRIYSGIKAGAYTVKVTDISEGGAYVESRHLPQMSETVSFELFDQFLKPIYFGNARVVRVKNGLMHRAGGFGLRFEKNIDTKIISSLKEI